MSVLNLGLQGCSLVRTAMDNKFEVTMWRSNGMNALRRAAEKKKAVVVAPTGVAPTFVVPDEHQADNDELTSRAPPMKNEDAIDVLEKHRQLGESSDGDD